MKNKHISSMVKGPVATPRSNDSVVEKLPLTSLTLPAQKLRIYAERAITTSMAILQKYGQLLPLLVSPEGIVIAGAEFLLAAQRLGLPQINVVRATLLKESDCKILELGLSQLPHLSQFDPVVIRDYFIELLPLDVDDSLHGLTGFTVGQLDVILDPLISNDAPSPADELPETPNDPDAVVRPNDVWNMGNHRVICGNALNSSTHDLLLQGRSCRMVFTDPPYNIPIAGNVSGLGKNKHSDFAMGVGEMSSDQFKSFLLQFLRLCCEHLIDGGLVYSFMDRRKLAELLQAASDAALLVFDLCIWNKLSGGMGGLYRSQHEPCLVFKHGIAPHINNVQLGKNGRHRTNVWDHRGLASFGKGRDEALHDHPTVKPVAMIAEAIKDCTKRGDIVLDPFAGSGSTIIAAEKTGRIGYGIELEPKYVEVTIRRWEKFTGKAAILEATGESFAVVKVRRKVEKGLAPHLTETPSKTHRPAVKMRQRPTAVTRPKETLHG